MIGYEVLRTVSACEATSSALRFTIPSSALPGHGGVEKSCRRNQHSWNGAVFVLGMLLYVLDLHSRAGSQPIDHCAELPTKQHGGPLRGPPMHGRVECCNRCILWIPCRIQDNKFGMPTSRVLSLMGFFGDDLQRTKGASKYTKVVGVVLIIDHGHTSIK